MDPEVLKLKAALIWIICFGGMLYVHAMEEEGQQ